VSCVLKLCVFLLLPTHTDINLCIHEYCIICSTRCWDKHDKQKYSPMRVQCPHDMSCESRYVRFKKKVCIVLTLNTYLEAHMDILECLLRESFIYIDKVEGKNFEFKFKMTESRMGTFITTTTTTTNTTFSWILGSFPYISKVME